MLQQQTRPFLVKTPAFPSYALKRVDRWMSSVFDIDASIMNCSKQAFGNPVDDLNFHMGRRGQLLINTFLQFANIPAFRTSKTIMY
ncbi:MAG: hypothetical protein QNK15_06710 [Cycloclasticus sp.]|nr:hypothetical protein [Cycloclasticus sp.]